VDGRAASYSEPGANLLVAAPGGDTTGGFPTLFTTDRVGTAGRNSLTFPEDPELSDYLFNSLGFSGTSGSTPLVSGVAALVLSANPNLTWRDVQHVLLQASVHFDTTDPDLATNGAGYRVSHNVGFGIPDAGQAVQLARAWSNRPPAVTLAFTNAAPVPIADDGLHVRVTGPSLPVALRTLTARPGLGPHPDAPTAKLTLVDVGLANSALTTNLTGKAALIERGGGTFAQKIQNAANAGAAFAVLFNNASPLPFVLGDTDFVPIPAVMISQTNGLDLREHLTSHPATAQLEVNAATRTFTVTNTLVLEHVQLRVTANHPVRGDLRITLTSPQGTRSVLGTLNSDTSPGPDGWTYLSTHHFQEGSAGTWTVAVTDEFPGDSGSLLEAVLLLEGVPIVDTDKDGLADPWELAAFGSLTAGPREDPDADGFPNAREQALGQNPTMADVLFQVDLSPWNPQYARLSWPGRPGRSYEVLAGTDLGQPLTLVTNLPTAFPEVEFFTPRTNLTYQFFRIREATP
jgi:hypothetical protein